MHKLLVLTLLCASCRSAGPFAVGEPLLPGIVESLEQQRQLPQYLVPSDSLTAGVLERFARERGILLSVDREIHCPWTDRRPTGYRVQITIGPVVADSARGGFRLSCSSPGSRGPFSTGGTAQLRRSGNRWVLVRWLDRWIT